MKIGRLLRILGGAALCIGALFSAAPALTVSASPSSLVCAGGVIAPGTYSSVNVKGDCSFPTGRMFVLGDFTVSTGAAFDGSSPAAQIIIYGNVKVDPYAVFVLGCSSDIGCETPTSDRIGGHLYGNHPLAIILHADSIHKGVTISGSASDVSCGEGGPYSALEDNAISGNVNISGMQSCWLGLFRNTVNGSVTFKNNVMFLTDANEVATNYIHGNLACYNNMPPAHVGDSGGLPNHVTGKKLGECATL